MTGPRPGWRALPLLMAASTIVTLAPPPDSTDSTGWVGGVEEDPFRFAATAEMDSGVGVGAAFRPTQLSLNSTTFNVTISTAPPGLVVSVDGVNVTSSQTYGWENGSLHNLSVDSAQGSGDTRHVFVGWSDGGARAHDVQVVGDTELVATFGTEYRLTVLTSPPNLTFHLDDVLYRAPASFWLAEGSSHIVNSGGKNILGPGSTAQGSLWSDLGAQSHTITVVGPLTLVAMFQVDHLLTVETPYGAAECGNYGCWYGEGTNATFVLTALPETDGRTRQDFRGWVLQPGNISVSRPIVMDGPKSVSAVWVTQHNLSVDGGYAAASGAGWHDHRSVVKVSIGATDVARDGVTWRFTGWTGAVNSTSPEVQVTVDGPKALTSTWKVVPTTSVETYAGLPLVIVLASLAAGGSLVLRSPRAEFALAALSIPLFTRLRKADVRGQYNRGRLMQFIEDNPGANYSQIRRRLGLGNGSCAYHLGVLERSGDVRRVSHSATVRFYPANYKFDAEALPPLAFVQRRVLEVLVAREGAGFGDISRALAETGDPVGEGNLSHHLRELSRNKELIATRREGRTTIYFLPEERRKYVAERLQLERGVDTVLERETFGAKAPVAPAAGGPQRTEDHPATPPLNFRERLEP